MLKRIVAALALAGALLCGCDAIESRAESERMMAQARRDEAQAQLVAAQAMSQTLALQAARAERLTSEVIRQSETTRLIALVLAGALLALIVGGVTVAALAAGSRRRETETIYRITARPAPPLPPAVNPNDLPEVRAMRRALEAARKGERR